jgi:hypothetical protein
MASTVSAKPRCLSHGLSCGLRSDRAGWWLLDVSGWGGMLETASPSPEGQSGIQRPRGIQLEFRTYNLTTGSAYFLTTENSCNPWQHWDNTDADASELSLIIQVKVDLIEPAVQLQNPKGFLRRSSDLSRVLSSKSEFRYISAKSTHPSINQSALQSSINRQIRGIQFTTRKASRPGFVTNRDGKPPSSPLPIAPSAPLVASLLPCHTFDLHSELAVQV